MKKPITWLTALSLVTLSAGACFDGQEVMEPPVMELEVIKHDVQKYGVSFTARIVNWDGKTAIQYEAIACSSLDLCVGTPFLEASRQADRITQPFIWSPDECDATLIFRAGLSNGQRQEAYHLTCS